MAANIDPIFSGTPNIGYVNITTAAANVSSAGDGTVGTSNFLLFSAGSNGSFVQKIRFNAEASAANVTSVATTLRIFLSTVNSGSTTAANTHLIAEISAPAIAASHSTNAASYLDVPLNIAIPSGTYILVSQHVAQTTNQNWSAVCLGGNY